MLTIRAICARGSNLIGRRNIHRVSNRRWSRRWRRRRYWQRRWHRWWWWRWEGYCSGVGTRLLHMRDEEENHTGVTERTRRKRGMAWRCRWWKSRGIKLKYKEEKETWALKRKSEKDEEGFLSSFSLFESTDGERDTEGE